MLLKYKHMLHIDQKVKPLSTQADLDLKLFDLSSDSILARGYKFGKGDIRKIFTQKSLKSIST